MDPQNALYKAALLEEEEKKAIERIKKENLGNLPETFEHRDAPQKQSDTQLKIDILFDNFAEFLKEKNRRYGDSALNPIKIFSKEGAGNQLCNRADDKVSRIKKSKELKKNDIADLFGYLALIMIEKNWIEFEDLVD